MTTPPIVTITDEVIAELESVDDFELRHYRAHIAALLAERAELKRDAERYRFWRHMATHEPSKMAKILAAYESPDQLDAAIDAAMQL